MIINCTEERNCLLLSISIFLLHLLTVNFYPVNFEFSFSEGAKFIDNFDKKVIDEYFFNQANTFVFPLFIGLINKFFMINDTLISAKLISGTSYVFLGIGFIKIFRYYKIKFSCFFFLIFFFLNPLIWTYGHRGIPDLFAASIAFYSFASILEKKEIKSEKNYIEFLLLGISICLKPFCLIYLGLIFLLEYNKDILKSFKKFFIPFSISLFLPFIYFLIIKINYGFYLIPEKFSSEVSFLKGGFVNNFLGYFIILSIFIFPLSFKKYFVNIKNIFFIIFILLPLSFYLGFIINSPQAELNFGSLNNIVGDEIIFFIGSISLFTLFLYIFDYGKNKQLRIKKFEFLITVLIYILILSLTRPSQRYLIIILPIVMMFFLITGNFNRKIIFYPVILLYIFFNIFLSINFYLNSSINKTIVEYLIQEDILKNTLPGPLYPHSYHFFYSKNEKSHIISRDPKNNIKEFKKNIYFLEKKFYLKKI